MHEAAQKSTRSNDDVVGGDEAPVGQANTTNAPAREWRMANGEWGMGNGEWRMANGEWRMANGEWRMANGVEY